MDKISIVIIMVIICRFFVGKVSKQASYFLWGIVALRLLFPVMMPSSFSIFNFVGENLFLREENKEVYTIILEETTGIHEYVAPELSEQKVEDTILSNEILSDEEISDNGIFNNGMSENGVSNDRISDKTAQDTIVSDKAVLDKLVSEKTENAVWNEDYLEKENYVNEGKTEKADEIFGWELLSVYAAVKDRRFFLWCIGVIAMLGYGCFSYWHLKYRLCFATKIEDGIFESEQITSPFVLGVLKPVIYLPLHLDEQEKRYILSHERYHIKRKDYLVKLGAYGLLSLYWFHPLVWLSFFLMDRDMEASCDEAVIKGYSKEERKAYSTLLLNFASGKRFSLYLPLSFGENYVKTRIKQVLQYRSPARFTMAAVILISVVLCSCCLTDEKKDENGQEIEQNTELAKTLFESKNPYLGDISANGKILTLLREYYQITGMEGVELQTYEEPYWITLSFQEKPNDMAMYRLSVLFLVLVENCEEVRWEFIGQDEKITTYSVATETVEKQLGCKDLKAYSSSAEKLGELIDLLDETIMNDIEQIMNISFLKEAAKKTELEWNELNQYEIRLRKDGVEYRGSTYTAKDCFYGDFDKNGVNDFILHVSDFSQSEPQTVIYIYMNEDELYTHKTSIYCWRINVTSGDIDGDGNVEFAYIGFTGGNGGSGSHAKGILKYENHSFVPMIMPGEFTEEDLQIGETGYDIGVYYGEEEHTYEIVCETLGIRETLVSEYSKGDDGSYPRRIKAGELVGANVRGFYEFEVIEENGRSYLAAEEYFHGHGGVNDEAGAIRFVFEWSKQGTWSVREYEIDTYPYRWLEAKEEKPEFTINGLKVSFSENLISEWEYEVTDGVLCGTYYDLIIETDIKVYAGEKEAIFQKAALSLTAPPILWSDLEKLDYEQWSAWTSDGKWIEVKFYEIPDTETETNIAAAMWEFEGNAFLLYGTVAVEGMEVVVPKTAVYMVGHSEKVL